MFGDGICLAESCLKADETAKPNELGWYPLVLNRVVMGKVKYCDAANPYDMKTELEAACKHDGGYHSVLGDSEKVRGTFREVVIFEPHQVYPEYILWYKRK